MRPILHTSNEVLRLENSYQIASHWEFLREAMIALNAPDKARADLTPESFFNMLTKTTALGEDGLVCILQSKNGKSLGFGCGFSAVDFNLSRCFYVWQAYSSGKCSTTLSELLAYCERHAKGLGLPCVKLSTPRANSAADRLFTQILGFTKEFHTYTKPI